MAPGRALASASSPAKSRLVLADVATSSTGEYMTLAIGWTSLRGSYGSLPRWGLSTSGLMAEKPRVAPSGTALATASMPMVPLAPARLSTTIVTPSWADSRSARARATVSLTPPAG